MVTYSYTILHYLLKFSVMGQAPVHAYLFTSIYSIKNKRVLIRLLNYLVGIRLRNWKLVRAVCIFSWNSGQSICSVTIGKITLNSISYTKQFKIKFAYVYINLHFTRCILYDFDLFREKKQKIKFRLVWNHTGPIQTKIKFPRKSSVQDYILKSKGSTSFADETWPGRTENLRTLFRQLYHFRTVFPDASGGSL